MPATNFPEYARQITDSLDAVIATGQARLGNLQIDQRSTLLGFIAGILLFDDDSELHFREFLDISLPEPKLMYAYHYQDVHQALIFRYDNAEHRPKLAQAEHKHMRAGVSTLPVPTLAQVIDEILAGK